MRLDTVGIAVPLNLIHRELKLEERRGLRKRALERMAAVDQKMFIDLRQLTQIERMNKHQMEMEMGVSPALTAADVLWMRSAVAALQFANNVLACLPEDEKSQTGVSLGHQSIASGGMDPGAADVLRPSNTLSWLDSRQSSANQQG